MKMKQNFYCVNCTHTDVCQYKYLLSEICNKINTKIDNVYIPSDNFEVIIRCKHYIDKQYINFFPTQNNKSNVNLPDPLPF